MKLYKIPDEFFFRLHHIRPRFKTNVEEVLLYVATSISGLEKQSMDSFNKNLNEILINFGKNKTLTKKTIDNWRTEISALFSFIQEEDDNLYPSEMARRLAKNQYLDEFFNYFLYTFQYPGGHNTSDNVVKQIEAGIRFKPCQFILSLFNEGNKLVDGSFYITAEELTFCAYFDLRVTTNKISPIQVAELIISNRKLNIKYDYRYAQLQKKKDGSYPSAGDVTRYAGDILDYMVLANLLKTKGTGFYYYLNEDNLTAIDKHLNSIDKCDIYEKYYKQKTIKTLEIGKLEKNWFDYVNSFEYIDEFLPRLNQQESTNISELVQEYYSKIKGQIIVPTKVIGDYGETLILVHEYLRTKNLSNRQHLINKIPTPLGVGYDLQSIEYNKMKRYIEVKTTRSKKAINFNRFKITPNEWDSAETLKDRYFIYYLVINDNDKKIFIIQDPVKQFEVGNLRIDKNLTVEFTNSSGEWNQLMEITC